MWYRTNGNVWHQRMARRVVTSGSVRCGLCKEIILIFIFVLSVFFIIRTTPAPPFGGAIVEYPGGHIPMIIHDDGRGEIGVTVVTAFFNIGSFQKGEQKMNVTPSIYLEWAKTFRYLINPLVVYTDSPEIVDTFVKLRSDLSHLTKIVKVDRDSLWAFKLKDRIQKIYSDQNYPKHSPNTIVPEYSCAQHAKYSCLEDAISEMYFMTDYFLWLDIGYFRDLVKRRKYFRMTLPHGFNTSKNGYNLVNKTGFSLRPERIFRDNIVRNGGGLVIGEATVLTTFIQHYKKTTERFLERGLSNSDQQVLYSMFTDSERRVNEPPVDIQEFSARNPRGDIWFYLGYLCYREIER